MATVDKDLEDLKKEHKELSDQLKRGAVLSLTILSVFVISFSRACDKTNGNEVKNTVCQIKKLSAISRRDENISYIFDNFDSTQLTCDANACPTPTPAGEASASPEPTPSVEPASGNITPQNPSASPTPTDLEMKNADECQSKLEQELETSAEKWFGVEPPIPGVKVNIDLRYWVFLLPPLYFLCAIYLHTLRMKLRVVEAVAAHRIEKSETDGVSAVSQLYFDKQSRYRRFPGALAAAVFVGVYVFLPLYLLIAGYSFWQFISLDSVLGFLFVFGVLTLYAVSYGHHITNRLNDEIARLTSEAPRANFIRAVRTRVSNVVQAIGNRVHPRVSLSLGSVLLLLTLGLAISQDSCEDKTFKGYEILVDANGAYWYPASAVLAAGADPVEAFQARIMYTSVLILALLAITLVVLPPLYRKLHHKRFRDVLLIVTGGFLIFTLLDFSADYVFIAPWDGHIKLVVLSVLMFVWIFHSFSKRVERRNKWKFIRASMLVFLTPLIVIAWLYAIRHLRLPGLIVFITGLHVLFFGTLQLQSTDYTDKRAKQL